MTTRSLPRPTHSLRPIPIANRATQMIRQPADEPKQTFGWPVAHDEATSFAASTLVHLVGVVIAGLLILPPPDLSRQISLAANPVMDEGSSLLPEVVFEMPQLEVQELPTSVTSSELAATLPVETTVIEPSAAAISPSVLDLDVDFGSEVAPLGDLLKPVSGGRRGSLTGIALGTELATFAKRLTRAGAKSGDVQISLIWNNFNDIDLHVITPGGELIFFGHRHSRCSGDLDVDMNAAGPQSREPVENIYWPAGKAPLGKYVVLVHHYAGHGDPDPTPFEVLVCVDGEKRTFKGVLSHGEPRLRIHEFERKQQPRPASASDDFPL